AGPLRLRTIVRAAGACRVQSDPFRLTKKKARETRGPNPLLKWRRRHGCGGGAAATGLHSVLRQRLGARAGGLDVRVDAGIVVHQLLEQPILPALPRTRDDPGDQRCEPATGTRPDRPASRSRLAWFAPTQHVRDGLPAANDPLESFMGGDQRTHLEL